MEKVETIEGFYKRKFEWMSDNIKNEIGHFNVFEYEPIDPNKIKPLPYKRRDYYKIMLVIGNIKMNYADRVVSIKKQALFFSNPQIPYSCESLENIRDGFYCIFNSQFFQQFAHLNQYAVFEPNGNHVFELDDEQVSEVRNIYKKMFQEIKSEYVHKYDVLRTLVLELLHFAMKMQAPSLLEKQPINASQRITSLFLELLERQFPIDENHLNINLRTASAFSTQLNIHVNHLNKSIKEITNKTTSQIIAERILQESKILLKQSSWNVAEIAYALGFTEVTHFNNFFKKRMNCSPSIFRKS